MYICIYIYIYLSIYLQTHIHTYVYVCIYTYVHLYTYIHIYIYIMYMYICIYMYQYECTHTLAFFQQRDIHGVGRTRLCTRKQLRGSRHHQGRCVFMCLHCVVLIVLCFPQVNNVGSVHFWRANAHRPDCHPPKQA